jgi:hypothetical protein
VKTGTERAVPLLPEVVAVKLTRTGATRRCVGTDSPSAGATVALARTGHRASHLDEPAEGGPRLAPTRIIESPEAARKNRPVAERSNQP